MAVVQLPQHQEVCCDEGNLRSRQITLGDFSCGFKEHISVGHLSRN